MARDTIKRIVRAQSVAYVLPDNAVFYPTGYKVLENYGDAGLLRCARYRLNGLTKLMYFTGELLPLESSLAVLGDEEAVEVCISCLEAVLRVEKNGFLDCDNLELLPELIFVDVKARAASLIYLPLQIDRKPSSASVIAGRVQNMLSVVFKKKDSPSKLYKKAEQLFSEAMPDLDMLLSRLQTIYREETGEGPAAAQGKPGKPGKQEKKKLLLKSVNLPEQISFLITQDEFVLGKSGQYADGVLGTSSAISRKHCKVCRQEGGYCIVDLGSLNGTFVNGRRLEGDERVALHAGDTVKLADAEFRVEDKKGEANA